MNKGRYFCYDYKDILKIQHALHYLEHTSLSISHISDATHCQTLHTAP